MKKRILAIVLTVVMLAACLGFRTSSTEAAMINSAKQKEFNDIMYEGTGNLLNEINISALKISVDDIVDYISNFTYDAPDRFYVMINYSYNYSPSTGNVVSLIPHYTCESIAERDEMMKVYDEAVAAVAKKIGKNWPDSAKMMYINDYICANFSYDTTYSNYDVYSLVTTKTGVCQAYSLYALAIMRECDMTGGVVTSEEMTHMWNAVNVNDSWYNVDMVWNDPVGNVPGKVNHNFFLKSADALIDGTGRSDDGELLWNEDEAFDATDYDNDVIWEDVTSSFVFVNGSWYFISRSTTTTSKYAIYSTTDFTNATEVKVLEDRWLNAQKTAYYVGYFSGLAAYNGLLIFNTPDKIVSYNPASGELATITAPENLEGSIIGSLLEGNVVHYYTGSTPNDSDFVEYTYTLTENTGFSKDFNAGLTVADVLADKGVTCYDADGAIMDGDALVPTGMIYEKDGIKYTIVVKGDTNNDGEITIADAMRVLKNIIADGYEVTYPQDNNGDGEYTLADAAAIVKKVVNSTYEIYC